MTNHDDPRPPLPQPGQSPQPPAAPHPDGGQQPYAPHQALDGSQPQYAAQPQYGAQPQHGAQLPTPAWAVRKPDPMPDGPREYQHLLRGGRHRWWRPLLAIVLMAAFGFLLIQLVFPLVMLIGVVLGVDNPLTWAEQTILDVDNMGPAGFFATNLSLIVLIPAAMWAIWIAHRIRPRFLTSVVGGIRWKWLARCLLITLPIWLVYMAISLLIDHEGGARPEQWVTLLIMVVVMTPLQAAGEEYAFRGFLLQTVGSWFPQPLLALIVPTVLSVGVFAAAHGSPNGWVLADLGLFALVAAVATWRTGGLEAAIVIHAVNNVSIFFAVILFGGWEDAFVGADTTSTPQALAVSAVVTGLALAGILWQAKRLGIQRLYQPTAQPAVADQAPPAQLPPPGPYAPPAGPAAH